jgi:predicted amidohydrolase
MKICIAQARPFKGDIEGNIRAHLSFADKAKEMNASVLIFPELSLSSYESKLAKALATSAEDERLAAIQQFASENNMIIGVGLPLLGKNGIHIGMVVFHPGSNRQVIFKKFLHADEYPYFVPGDEFGFIDTPAEKIAIAICYELSVPMHSENAVRSGAGVYLASVAKSKQGVEKAYESLSRISSQNSIFTMMCNCLGPSDDFFCTGNSAIWDKKGHLMEQLDDNAEGLLLLDTNNNEVNKLIL